MTDKWTVIVEEDTKTGDLILPLPNELITQMGWGENDTLIWAINEDTKEISLTKRG